MPASSGANNASRISFWTLFHPGTQMLLARSVPFILERLLLQVYNFWAVGARSFLCSGLFGVLLDSKLLPFTSRFSSAVRFRLFPSGSTPHSSANTVGMHLFFYRLPQGVTGKQSTWATANRPLSKIGRVAPDFLVSFAINYYIPIDTYRPISTLYTFHQRYSPIPWT
jgi:hypothetical protein